MKLRERLFGRKKRKEEAFSSEEALHAAGDGGEREHVSKEGADGADDGSCAGQEGFAAQTHDQEDGADSGFAAQKPGGTDSGLSGQKTGDASNGFGGQTAGGVNGGFTEQKFDEADSGEFPGQIDCADSGAVMGNSVQAGEGAFAVQESGGAAEASMNQPSSGAAHDSMNQPTVEGILDVTEEESGDKSIFPAGQESSLQEEASEERDASGEGGKSKEKKGFFARLKAGLAKTRNNIVRGIDSLFNGFSAIDDDFYEELEEILIMGDIGVNATMEIVARLKSQVKEQHIKEPKQCKQLLIEGIKEQMRVDDAAYDFEKQQSVIMVIGVNGVGKTTSVGKLAGKLKDDGRKVLIAAADTFRAAAGDQLAEWARRADVPMVGGNEGADPASVVFDAVNAAKARGVDVLLIDTAGRLHNKKNLMEELRKMNRIIDREFPNAHRENLIVLDGTTGQNALVQAREFGAVAELTGIILTKMDGTAKGGIAVAIQSELRVPVKYIGVGETIDDLQKFDSDEFVNALFDMKVEEEEEESTNG